MCLAHVAVSESRSQVLSPPHLLVGIPRASPGTVERFMSADASASALATELLQGVAGHESVAMSGEVPFSREARRVLRTAGVEAARSGDAVRPEHLLLGLLGHAGGVTGDLLRAHGVRDQIVRTYIQTSKDTAR
jgi:ATP-dependent Clp protease ATP-binding subunit ClpA